jgi:hypothetical protein
LDLRFGHWRLLQSVRYGMAKASLSDLEHALHGDKERASAPAFCGDIDMRIARDGTWFYHGSPIGRKPLVKLFATVLSRDEHGDYWLTTPAEQCRIHVDDAAFVAIDMNAAGDGAAQQISFTTNVDDTVVAGAEHPIRIVHDSATGEPTPYIHVRGRLEALIARPVYYRLVDIAVERGEELGVWSSGVFFSLGKVDA